MSDPERRVLQAADSPNSALGLAVNLGDELNFGRRFQVSGHGGECAGRRRERLADRGTGHERIGIGHAAARIELEPVMRFGLGESCGSSAGSEVCVPAGM